MEKRTILAVVLSTLVIMVFYVAQGILYPPPMPEQSAPSQTVTQAAPAPETESSAPTVETLPDVTVSAVPTAGNEAGFDEPAIQAPVVIDNGIMVVELSNSGGDIVSLKLKEHLENGTEPVEMILGGDTPPHAFSVAFGNEADVLGGRVRPVDAAFKVRRVSDMIVEFARDFTEEGGGRFTLVKRYEFKPNEYLFQLNIILDGGSSVRGYDFGGAAYTISSAPQIGPYFTALDNRYDYRHYYSFKEKFKNEKVNNTSPTLLTDHPLWASIAGKYFAFIALPYVSQYTMAFSTMAEPGLSQASRLLITRQAAASSRIDDKYQFFVGPKDSRVLEKLDNADNGWKLQGNDLIEVANTRGFLAPLETLLKWILEFFNWIFHNWGVAIIMLTLLVKIVMFPLTKKSSESTLRMQSLSPKIKELQDKYKDNPQKLNAEMAAFYKKEGYNPMSGCLPMIIQIPIFFAMYNLFNNHFDLRGAMFIPGWIPDLSLPESIYHFTNFRIPILGWTDIRLLPIIYVASQLLYGKVTQTPDQQGNAQMKIMLYAMPIIFFFILYDVPSGLLVYWIFSNVLTMVQQLAINKVMAKKRAEMGTIKAEAKQPVLPPKKKKKK